MSMMFTQSGSGDFNADQIPSAGGRWLLDLRSSAEGHWVAWRGDDGAWLAAARVVRAETSSFQEVSKLDARRLDQSIALEAVWLHDRADAAELLPALLYTTLRAGRIWGRNSVVAYVDDTDSPVAQLARFTDLSRAPKVSVKGTMLSPAAQTLELSLHHTAAKCSPAMWAVIQPTLVDEVVTTLKDWFPVFFQGSWAQSIIKGEISREQYIYCLQNMHHYVKQTTRHCARAVTHSEDRALRNHWIKHLNGELNHELSIERDLRHLGVDPEYVIKHSVPSTATKEFQAIQETTIGFYQDPVLLMACPLAAEGITAHIDDHFITTLRATVASWGVDKPEKATTFLLSHTNTDGGDDGHWEMTINTLRTFLTDEGIQRRFLTTLRAAMDCVERSFNSNVDERKLFSATL